MRTEQTFIDEALRRISPQKLQTAVSALCTATVAEFLQEGWERGYTPQELEFEIDVFYTHHIN
jgi:hypothetical protein